MPLFALHHAPIPARLPGWRACRDRRGGRDHIWLVTHDEASCYVPAAIKSASIILSHWGRKDPNHTSGTGFPGNVYHLNVSHPHWEPEGSMAKLDLSQPCHDPVKVRWPAGRRGGWAPAAGGVPGPELSSCCCSAPGTSPPSWLAGRYAEACALLR